MRCMLCQQHATFDQTVFMGTDATTVRLCPGCATEVHAQEHVAKIRSADGREAKTAAVGAFLKALGK